MLVSLRSRLIEQFQRATTDGGRFEALERQRFVLNLLQRLDDYQRTVTSSPRPFDARAPWEHVLTHRAARQGREVSNTLTFIMDDLRAYLGDNTLRETLSRCGGAAGLALSRRLVSRCATSNLRLAGVRTVVDGAVCEAELESSVLDVGECARHDIVLPLGAKKLTVAIGVDNTGLREAGFTGVEVRTQVQTGANGQLCPGAVSVFGSLHRVRARSRTWIALRGINLLDELRAELAPGADIYGVRLLLARK